jgi:hemoglobin
MSRLDLAGRADIDDLLRDFYGQALTDELLRPVFQAAHLDLVVHLPRIAGFWERALFGTGTYSGRPMQVHRELVDTAGLTERHFARWLVLWHQVLADRFAGPVATEAAEQATRMAAAMIRAFAEPTAGRL